MIGNVSAEDGSEQQEKEKTAKMEFIISQFVKEIEQLQSEQMRLQLMLEPLERFRTENKNLKKEVELLKVLIAREPRSISATNEAELKRIREQVSELRYNNADYRRLNSEIIFDAYKILKSYFDTVHFCECS